MKKITAYIIAVLFAAVFIFQLSGCKSSSVEGLKELKEKYPEWTEAILGDLENIRLAEVTDGSVIVLKFNNVGTKTRFPEYIALEKKHNDFLNSNPGYFASGQQFAFTGFEGGAASLAYMSDLNVYGGILCEWDEDILEKNEDGNIRCFYVDESFASNISDLSVSIPAPILVINFHFDTGIYNYEGYFDFLECFTDLETIIINNVSSNEIEEVIQAIRKYKPDVEIIRTQSYMFLEIIP